MSRVVVALFLFASTLFAQNVDVALLRHFDLRPESCTRRAGWRRRTAWRQSLVLLLSLGVREHGIH